MDMNEMDRGENVGLKGETRDEDVGFMRAGGLRRSAPFSSQISDLSRGAQRRHAPRRACLTTKKLRAPPIRHCLKTTPVPTHLALCHDIPAFPAIYPCHTTNVA